MFTRRTATVTMSAPDAVCACAITACDGYLPVPTMSRDRKVRQAMMKCVLVMGDLRFAICDLRSTVTIYGLRSPLSGAYEVDNLDAIAVVHHRVGKQVPRDYF